MAAALAFSTARASSSSLLPAAPAALPRIRYLFPSLSELLGGWLLRATPKKKVSHSRKSMRSANKHLKPKSNISVCQGCGQPKRSHHLCQNCYSSISRRFKSLFRSPADEAKPQEFLVEAAESKSP